MTDAKESLKESPVKKKHPFCEMDDSDPDKPRASFGDPGWARELLQNRLDKKDVATQTNEPFSIYNTVIPPNHRKRNKAVDKTVDKPVDKPINKKGTRPSLEGHWLVTPK